MVALDSLLTRLAHHVDLIAPDIFCWELCDIQCLLESESIRFWNPVFVAVASEFFDGIGCVGLAVVEFTGNRQIRSTFVNLACLQTQVLAENTRRLNQGDILN